MVLEIGYTCIVIGLLLILGLVYFSKQKIGVPLAKAGACLAIPILILWGFYYFGFGFAEAVLLDWPYQIPFFTILVALTFLYNGFTKKQIVPFLVFLIGFLSVYFGLFFVLLIANLRIGF